MSPVTLNQNLTRTNTIWPSLLGPASIPSLTGTDLLCSASAYGSLVHPDKAARHLFTPVTHRDDWHMTRQQAGLAPPCSQVLIPQAGPRAQNDTWVLHPDPEPTPALISSMVVSALRMIDVDTTAFTGV